MAASGRLDKMSKRVVLGLVGVAMMSFGCGTSPTAVSTPAVPGSQEGMAEGSSLRNTPPIRLCSPVKIGVKAYAVARSGDKITVSLHAFYFDADGKDVSGECLTGPVWTVTTTSTGASIFPSRFDPFEARLRTPAGSHMVTAMGPDGIFGQTLVILP
jgi:hypothetical protein